MYAGRIVEQGPVRDVFANPQHPYTQALLRSTISLSTQELHSIPGAPPDLVRPADRLPLPSALPARDAGLRDRPAAAAGRRRAAAGRVLAAATRPDRRAARSRWSARRCPLPTKPELTAATATTTSSRSSRSATSTCTSPCARNAVARLVGGSSGIVHAVDGVNFDLAPGEVLGLVGESGSGKSTLGRALLGLVRPTSGSITYRGQELVGLSESSMRPLRRKLQMVFQDPHASLNPSMTVGKAIADALRIHGLHDTKRASGRSDRDRAVDAALERVGLAPARRFSTKYPAELSGGQKQRAVIARAIALGPELLVADEPISMLDMSVRAKILGLLEELKRDLGLTYVYITHDLASARFFCDRIAIMYLGKIVEIGPTAEIFEQPAPPVHQGAAASRPRSRPVARRWPATCPAARSPTPPTRRPAARSTRAAPRRSGRAAGRPATSGWSWRSAGPAYRLSSSPRRPSWSARRPTSTSRRPSPASACCGRGPAAPAPS